MLDIDVISEQKDYKKDLNCGIISKGESCYYFLKFIHNGCNYYIKPDNIKIFSLEIYNNSNHKIGFKIISDKEGIVGSWKIKSNCVINIHQSFISDGKLALILDKSRDNEKFVFKIISPTNAKIMCPLDDKVGWLVAWSYPSNFVPL